MTPPIAYAYTPQAMALVAQGCTVGVMSPSRGPEEAPKAKPSACQGSPVALQRPDVQGSHAQVAWVRRGRLALRTLEAPGLPRGTRPGEGLPDDPKPYPVRRGV